MRASAHPRSRGENFPPRCQRSAQQRLIPAHAGKTFRRKAGFSDWPAHPRSRGENAWTARGRSTGSGSSPLTRGKRGQGDDDAHTWRLIPAHAGKTTRMRLRRRSSRAHPRSRGENKLLSRSHLQNLGSSPLTRGKHECDARYLRRSGLIPAHAGKTGSAPRRIGPRGAHPRSRGENELSVRRCQSGEGSSPLTRGKPSVTPTRVGSSGLIPAHAGKTVTAWAGLSSRRAHPRSRGENTRVMRAGWLSPGSSPLTRGKRHADSLRRPRAGLIPAHAGKTGAATGAVDRRRAHPRSRGENKETHDEQ